MKDVIPGMFDKIPDYMLIRDGNSLEKSDDPFGLADLINAELDRRWPDVKSEVIGYDENGREIWLDTWAR